MEVLIRWWCPCVFPREICRYCKGRGFVEDWIELEFLRYLDDVSYIIRDRRIISLPENVGAA